MNLVPTWLRRLWGTWWRRPSPAGLLPSMGAPLKLERSEQEQLRRLTRRIMERQGVPLPDPVEEGPVELRCIRLDRQLMGKVLEEIRKDDAEDAEAEQEELSLPQGLARYRTEELVAEIESRYHAGSVCLMRYSKRGDCTIRECKSFGSPLTTATLLELERRRVLEGMLRTEESGGDSSDD